jgi:hypothetical protein
MLPNMVCFELLSTFHGQFPLQEAPGSFLSRVRSLFPVG